MKLLFARKQYEDNPFIRFSSVQLDDAEKSKDGLIGFYAGVECFLQRYINEELN